MTISYRARSQNELRIEAPARQRIANAFKQIAEIQGYKCNARGKRTEEMVCVGPSA